MAIIKFLLIFAIFICCSFGETCRISSMTPRANLDLEKFGGEWFRIDYGFGEDHPVGEPLYKCFSVHFDTNGIGNFTASTRYIWKSTGEWMEEFGLVYPDAEESSIWISDWNGTKVEQVILGVDQTYSEWVLYYGCQNGVETMALMSRDRVLDPKVREVLRDFAGGWGFPRDNLIEIDQTDCPSQNQF